MVRLKMVACVVVEQVSRISTESTSKRNCQSNGHDLSYGCRRSYQPVRQLKASPIAYAWECYHEGMPGHSSVQPLGENAHGIEHPDAFSQREGCSPAAWLARGASRFAVTGRSR